MRVYKATDVGRLRTMNQDYVFADNNQIGNLKNLLIVADGMGGHLGGDYASIFVVENLVRLAYEIKEKEPVSILTECISKVNELLWLEAQNNDDLFNMGTTLVAATVLNDKLYVANVGDSRLYLIDDDIKQITRDHSLVEELVIRGDITKSEARIHPDKNKITRAIGIERSVKIDFFECDLTSKSKILLCSDGLTNMITDEEIFDIAVQNRDLSEICSMLVLRANEEGGRDNISVVMADNVLDINSCGEEL